jgi:hypothetical protein
LARRPDLLDVADLLLQDRHEAGEFCSEVAWHVTDRRITYAMIAAVLEAHPRTDPTPRLVAKWIMETPAPEEDDSEDYLDIEYERGKDRLSPIQKHDFRDAQAGIQRCPHGIPITQRCRICRPVD